MGAGQRRIEWSKIILEGGFVALGVLLALVADEWRQSHADRKHAASALASIREELDGNRRSVQAALEYHLQLTSLLQPGTVTPRLFSRGFVAPAAVLQTAWESARVTDALRHLEYADVVVLARVYEQQRAYEQQARDVSALVFERLFNDGVAGMLRNVEHLSGVISTFWYSECRLLNEYNRVFEQLEGKPISRAPLPDRCNSAIRPAS